MSSVSFSTQGERFNAAWAIEVSAPGALCAAGEDRSMEGDGHSGHSGHPISGEMKCDYIYILYIYIHIYIYI